MFILESIVLGPKQRLVLLRCGDERFLVGTGPEGIQTIVPTRGLHLAGTSELQIKGEQSWG
jgi:flagellar biogenesis protein FliO